MAADSGAAASPLPLRVSVACSACCGDAVEVTVSLVAGSTALDALRASGLLERFPEIDISAQSVGLWARPCQLDSAVSDGDRVEIYRPLQVDPKEARRRRAKRLSAT